ncbi:35865_t:CDS:2, partial [Racocetra persica]
SSQFMEVSSLIEYDAIIKNTPVISEDHITITLTIKTKDYIGQGNVNQEFECQHLYQKSVNLKTLPNLSWLNKLSKLTVSDSNITIDATRTIALRVKGENKHKKTSATKLYLRLKSYPKITDLAKNILNQSANTPD